MYIRLTLAVLTSTLALLTANMANAENAPSPVALLMKHKPNQASGQAEHFVKMLNLSLTKAECEEIEHSLTEAYGPATRARGNLRIWEVSNNHKSSEQSKIVTIIAGERDGRYFAKLDRQGFAKGNNPRLNKNFGKPKLTPKPYTQSKRVRKSYNRD